MEKFARDCSIIVTGDFNEGEGSPPYRALFDNDHKAASLLDAYRVAHPDRKPDEGTFNGFDPKATCGERIDWIACSRDWSVRAAAIDRAVKDGRTPSDHFAVHAELKHKDR